MSTIQLPEIIDCETSSSCLKNCIRNNYKHLRKWARRTQTNAFRLYDRAIKAHPLVVDFYAGRFCVQHFSYDPLVDAPLAELQAEIFEVLQELFGAKKEEVYWKVRERRRGLAQYEKLAVTGRFFSVVEHGLSFLVNLEDYLDTGLFLDHRETRHLVRQMSQGKRVLNLFAYTCAFSIHAAAGGASFTKSVDMSNTYTAWGRENFLLNGFSQENHPIERADCLKFLQIEKECYDLIIIDPPTISRSTKMEKLFDIQADHKKLILSALRRLNPGGKLLFSTNFRKFELEASGLKVREITDKTLSLDTHNKKVHRCWLIDASA